MSKVKRVVNKLKGRKILLLVALFVIGVGSVGTVSALRARAAVYSTKAEIPAEKVINGTVYTKDRPYKIVEVVPANGAAQATWGWSVGGTSMPISIEDLDFLYHTIGGPSYSCCFLEDEYKEQGSCKWNNVVAPGASKSALDTAKEEMQAAICDTYVASFSVNNWQVTGRNTQKRADGKYGTPTDWTKPTNGDGGWFGDYFYPNGDGTFSKVMDRNFLAHALFENATVVNAIDHYSEMTDKLVIEVVEADKLTKSVIDGADMVYLNSKAHNNNVINANNKFVQLCNTYGIGSGGATAGLTRTYKTATAQTGLGFSEEAAMHMYIRSSLDNMPIAIDWSTANLSGNTGFDKLCCVALGIETDTFVSEYAYKKVGENSYAGNNGRTFIDGSGKWVIEQAEVNWYGNITKNKILDWGGDMFIQSHGNVAAYPYFNAGTSGADTMHKNIYAYYGNNALDMELINGHSSMTAGERNDAGDAKELFKTDQLSIRNCLQYIMGLFGDGARVNIHVAEVQPWGEYRYNSEEGARKILKMFGVFNEDVELDDPAYQEGNYTVYPLQTYIFIAGARREDKKYYVKIRSLSMNAFNGITEDLAATYDLIIMDSYNPNDYIRLRSDSNNSSIPYIGVTNVGKSGKTERTMSGNDLTDKMYERLYNYVATGMPLFMSRQLYYGDNDTIDSTADNLISMTWAKLNKKLRAENKPTYNVATTAGMLEGDAEPSSDKFKSNTVLLFPDRVDFRVVSPVQYKASDTGTLYKPEDVKFTINVSGIIPAGSNIKLYIDRNADALYNDDSTSPYRELYSDYDVPSDITTGNYNIPLDTSSGDLPRTWFGYFKFKVQITKPDGLPTCVESAFALIPNKERTVNVLQVYTSVDGKGYEESTNLNMLEDTVFDDAFSAIYGITKMKLDVDTIDTVEFSAKLKENPDYLRPYSIVVIGFCDSYGKTGTPITDPDVLNSMKEYVESNRSILFTHDTMTYTYSSGSDKLNENEMTKALTVPIGMQGSNRLTNSLLTKLGFMSTFKNIGYSSSNDKKTKMTSEIEKLNWGQITEYPYEINNRIDVKDTHGQFYRLNLEKMDTLDEDKNVMNGVYNSYVTTWFTLDDDGNSFGSEYFDLTGQDAMNNYYIYSKGNVTYTSAGHSKVDDSSTVTDEMRLFVNTLIRSIIVSVTPPEVVITNGAALGTNNYEIVGRPGSYGTDGTWSSTTSSTEEGVPGVWNPASGIPLKFMPKDEELSIGAPFTGGIIYVDVDDDGVYDSSTDYLLKTYGYAELLNETEKTEDIAALATAAGCIDQVGNLYTTNQLKIGIRVQNTVKTSAQAFGRYIRRKYFELD